MPNWCFNFATIISPSREIYDKLLNAITENKWFQTFAPINLDPEIHENEWDYVKAIEIWKTKWAATDVDILNQYDDELLLEIRFETAWSPPFGVYSIMKKNYGFEINAIYDEEGCEFFGKCIYSKEEELDETYNFPSNKKELEALRKVIGSELDDYMYSTWERLEEEWQQEEEEEEDEDDEDSLPELIEIHSDEEDEEICKPEINEINNFEW
jgi:hypothetical protein